MTRAEKWAVAQLISRDVRAAVAAHAAAEAGAVLTAVENALFAVGQVAGPGRDWAGLLGEAFAADRWAAEVDEAE